MKPIGYYTQNSILLSNREKLELSRELWRDHVSGFGTVIDLSGCSFALGRNHVCDALLCKFRCSNDLEPDGRVKIGLELCPRNNEYKPGSPHERLISNE